MAKNCLNYKNCTSIRHKSQIRDGISQSFENLRILVLEQTQATDAGVKNLQEASPNLRASREMESTHKTNKNPF
jgi:hypothetical protein